MIPLVSFMSSLDWHWEAEVTDRMDRKEYSNEWDGVVAFCLAGDEDAEFKKMQSAAAPTEITRKAYKDVVEMAMEKYPTLDWHEKSHMPTSRYLACLEQVDVAIATGKPGNVRNIDTVVADVIIGRRDCSIAKVGDNFEVFQGWEMGKEHQL